MPTLIDSVIAILVAAGATLLLAAGLRLLRAKGAAERLPALSKLSAVGLSLLVLGLALAAGDFSVFLRAGFTGLVVLAGAAFATQALALLVTEDSTDPDL